MRTDKRSFLRLYLLAEHLKNNSFKPYPDVYFLHIVGNNYRIRRSDRVHCSLPWILYEIPFLFPDDWAFDSKGYVIFRSRPQDKNLYVLLMEYMGLFDIRGFVHLYYELSQRTELYKGKILMRKYTPADVAENIFCFLQATFEELQRMRLVADRSILIEKCKPKLNPAVWLSIQLNILRHCKY